MQLSPWLIAVVVVIVVPLIFFAVWLSIRAHRRRIAAGREDLLGKTAEVLTIMEPRGTVFVEGERWTAISENNRLEPGEEVVITKVDGLKLWVAKKTEEEVKR